MYPYKIIWDLDLYSILITVGLIACMILIRVLSDKRGLSAKWQNFVLVTMVFTVVIGYGSAVVFQALYNMERDGGFHITKSTGQTCSGTTSICAISRISCPLPPAGSPLRTASGGWAA